MSWVLILIFYAGLRNGGVDSQSIEGFKTLEACQQAKSQAESVDIPYAKTIGICVEAP